MMEKESNRQDTPLKENAGGCKKDFVVRCVKWVGL